MPIERVDDYLDVIRNGIRKQFGDARPRKVVIVGAGVAGLVAAYELLQAGHEPLILEAQHRLGGRILTLREPSRRDSTPRPERCGFLGPTT